MIREIKIEEYQQLQYLYAQLQPEDPVMEENHFREILEAVVKSDQLFIFVKELEGHLVASCYLNIVPNLTRAGRSYGLIENVVTEQKHRKRGFGKAILQIPK